MREQPSSSLPQQSSSRADLSPPPRGASLRTVFSTVAGLIVAIGCDDKVSESKEQAPCRDATQRCTGTVMLPLDRSGRHPGKIQVAYLFVPGRGPDVNRTVAYLEGGPGYAGIESASLIENALGSVLDDANLLIMDYRGVGQSAPLLCPDLPDPSAQNTEGRPTSPQIGACIRELTHERLLHFGTAAAMDDLEDVREALNLGSLDLFGASYGVFAAEVFAARHPESVRSVTFHAGPLASDRSQAWPWMTRFAQLPMQALDSVCARFDCDNRSRLPSQLWREAVERIRADDVPQLTLADAITLHRYATSGPEIVSFARAISALVLDDAPADLAALAEALQPQADGEEEPRETKTGLNPSNSNALFLHVLCNDLPVPFELSGKPSERAEQLEAARSALPANTFDPFTKDEWNKLQPPLAELCVHWSARVAIAPPTEPPSVSGPVLFVYPELDVTQPDRQFLTASYPGAKILEIQLGSHGGVFESTCARAELRRFLTSGQILESSCLPDGE